MPEELSKFKSTLIINGQEIGVTTRVGSGANGVNYNLSADKVIPPDTVALVLYLMCRDICDRQNITIDQLTEGLVESDLATH